MEGGGGLLALSCHVEPLMAARGVRNKEQSSSAADVTRRHCMGWERLSGRVTDTSPHVPARDEMRRY